MRKIATKDTLELRFLNKTFPKKPIYLVIKRGPTIFDVKRAIYTFFSKFVKPTITDFRLVRPGPRDEINDTIEDNFFDEKYNNEEAYDLMLLTKNRYYYHKSDKEPNFIYFRVIKSKISTQIYHSSGKHNFSFPLPLVSDNIYLTWENKIKEFIRNDIPDIDYLPFHPFQNTENLDEISKDDIKKYYKDGLILFIFPIQAQFIYNFQRIDILLKFNQPLKDYLKQLKITSDIKHIFFRMKGKDNSFEIIDSNVPIHEILKKQKKEPVFFEVLEQLPQKIHVTIPFYNTFVDINFEYKEKDTIFDLIRSIKHYFDIDDEIELLKNGTMQVKNNDQIKGIIYLLLQYKKSNQIELSRSFIINGEIIKKNIDIYETVNLILKDIAKKLDTEKTLITLSIDGMPLNPEFLFASYFIPPEKQILVDIKEFQEFMTLKIYENEKSPIEIKVGFTQKMKLKSLKNSKTLRSKISHKHLSELFFFLDDKLDEKETFEHYKIKNGQIVNAYASKFYIYKYNGETSLISANKSFGELNKTLQKHFKLLDDQFFIDYNGKMLTKKEYEYSNIPNGTIFQVMIITKMIFLVDNEYEIIVNSNQQIDDIIKIYSTKSKKAPDTFALVNDEDVQLQYYSYIYSAFANSKKQCYNISTKKARKFTFQSNYKFFMEPFIPSTTIGEALHELINRGKNIDENSFVIFMGKIIDNKDTFEKIYHNIDEEDEQPLVIENEIPELIKIGLNFQFEIGNKDEKIFIRVVRSTEVLNIHYWASIISGQKFDNITLLADDKPMNDDEMLDDDTIIFVKLNAHSEINDELDKTEKNELDELKESESYYIGEDEEKYHQVLSTIGEGEFSISYKVADTKTDQLMCKKMLKMISNDDTRFKVLKNAIKEFETLYQIHHPCVCKAFGINIMEAVSDAEIESEDGEETTTVALFFEYLEYSLLDCMKIMNNTLKTKIVVEIAHAMNAIHKHGFIHRDLKIENIRLNDIFEAKIIDFGLVRIHECLFNDYSFLNESMTRCWNS